MYGNTIAVLLCQHTYTYFGEDEFFLSRTIKQLKTHTLDQQWANFNYTEYPPESEETIPQALSDIMTPPVGSGGRLVHLPNSTLLGVCSKEILMIITGCQDDNAIAKLL